MIINKKICSKCGDEKLLEEFYKQKLGYLGRRADCKICSNKNIKKWNLNNPTYSKEYYKLHPDNRKDSSKKYYKKNRIKCLEYGKEYYNSNKDKLNKYGREYHQKNSNYLNNYNKEWRKNNPEKCREYARNRYKKNIELATIKWMRNFLYRTEKQGYNKINSNTINEFNYTPEQLIKRIECQFKEGMSWNNRNKWHIDHKKPISAFKDGTSPRIINMLCNLQPIWKLENLSKGNRF